MLYFWNFRHRHMPSYSYIHTKKCTPYNSFQQTWTQHLQGTVTNCPKRCTSRTFPILCPKRVIGIHGKDLFEMVSTQVLSSPSVRQLVLQCKELKFFDREDIPLAWDQCSTRIFHSRKISCHCVDQFVPGGGPTMLSNRIIFPSIVLSILHINTVLALQRYARRRVLFHVREKLRVPSSQVQAKTSQSSTLWFGRLTAVNCPFPKTPPACVWWFGHKIAFFQKSVQAATQTWPAILVLLWCRALTFLYGDIYLQLPAGDGPMTRKGCEKKKTFNVCTYVVAAPASTRKRLHLLANGLSTTPTRNVTRFRPHCFSLVLAAGDAFWIRELPMSTSTIVRVCATIADAI